MTCNARRGTPTSGLEIILDVPPIDLFIKAEAAKSAFRLIGTNDEIASNNGHINAGKSKLHDLGVLNLQIDKIGKQHVWEQKYTTIITVKTSFIQC